MSQPSFLDGDHRIDGEPIASAALERLRAENEKLLAELQASHADLDHAHERMFQLAAIVESSEDAVIGCSSSGLITSWNNGAERLFGYAAAEMVQKPMEAAADFHWPEEIRAMKEVLGGSHVPLLEAVRRRKDGKEVHVSVRVSPVHDRQGGIVGASVIARDITEKRRLETLIRHAQKMEAVGQLAGGIAHDFNNLLTVIAGCTEVLLHTCADSVGRPLLMEIHRASDRAASLTRQLLAFSRKQVLTPKIVDLNDVVRDVEKMLVRLLGADIDLKTAMAAGLKPVKIDPGQMEQVLVNLAVNARDAMPCGGKLTIETANVVLDQAYANSRTNVKPGRYVMVAVSDEGTGMTDDIRSRIFEPFFTTKEAGKGTGLGLAMVYGIVNQSGGDIYVYSEPGCGTTFKIYLPAMNHVPTGATLHDFKPTAGGSETILIVEDEAGVRRIARIALETHGYRVLEASCGHEAVHVAMSHQGVIHLVVSDVVMPDLSGPQVVTRLRELRPDLKALYVSGYTNDAVFRHGVLDAEVEFLQKPFTAVALAGKVRALLDGHGA
jgi:two-component system cell cycle sensor histidine kinase/response regulator CckA